MTNSRNPFRINVGFIIHEEVGYSHEIPFESDRVNIEDLELCGVLGKAVIGRTPQGLIVQASLSAETSLECVRCLKGFDQSIAWHMTELYAFTKKSVSESGLLLPEDAHIDFAPLIREYALLEIPINPLCKPDCRGLCSVCGENLNEADCGHHREQGDSPFAALRDLF